MAPSIPDRARRRLLACAGVLCALLAAPVLAQAPAAAAVEATARERLEALQAATVGVEVSVIDGASSARTLGRRREGTGIVIAPQGLVLTIGYLVLEAERVELITRDQKRLPAQVVAYDFVNGLGLLRPLFPLAGVQPVRIGSAAALPKGSPLLFITGSTPRQAGAVRLVDARPFTGYWEYHLDSALYTSPLVPANHSGAGLFNLEGELVGVGNLAMRDVMPDDSPSVLPGNLFVPADVLTSVLADLLRTGEHPQAKRPWLGVNAAELAGGVRITRVNPNSPAEAGGLRPGHWVLAVDDQPVRSLEAFYKQVWARGVAGSSIRVSVREGSAVRVLELPVRDRSMAIERPKGI
jgi:serine protease Do